MLTFLQNGNSTTHCHMVQKWQKRIKDDKDMLKLISLWFFAMLCKHTWKCVHVNDILHAYSTKL